MPPTGADAYVGKTVGKFRIEQKLGEGGMGAVYRAVDTTLDRPVALKVIRPNVARSPDFVARFRREAKAAARLRHPGVIEVYEYSDGETTGGLVTMALELAPGRELREVIRQAGALPYPLAVDLVSQILEALAAAHRAGIVHRDLKPHNVIVSDGPSPRTKILDFGIAKLRDPDDGTSQDHLTAVGQIMGTVAYMAPEQAEGSSVDARADLYAVGVILYQCLTGKLPFTGDSALSVLHAHRKAPIPLLERPELAAFDPVIQRALAKRPEGRFPSADAFRHALQQALQTAGPPPLGTVRRGSGRIPQQTGYGRTDHTRLETWGEQAPTQNYQAPPDPSDSALAHSGVTNGLDTVPPPGAAMPTPDSQVSSTPAGLYATGNTDQFFGALCGRTVGQYAVEELLGAGGMGAVFRAKDKLLGRTVAIKVVHPTLSHRADIRQRFLREARAALEFVHPNAVATRSCDETSDGLLYMVQDFSPGRGLRTIVQEVGRLPVPRALSIGRQVALALTEAHRKGIVHRDLKPENMLVEDDGAGGDIVRVCDFGLAKMLDTGTTESGESLTAPGQAMGTPHYMAPEQVEGGTIDGRVDVYALGCVLYELLTGHKPFDGDSVRQVILMHLGKEPTSLRERAPEARIPEPVDTLVLSTLAKESDGRPTAAELVAGLEACLAGAPLPSRSGVDDETLAPRPPRRSPLLPAVFGAAVLLIGAGAVLLVPGLRARVGLGPATTAGTTPPSPPTEQPPTEQPPTEQPPTEQPPTEQPPTEQPPTEQPPTEQPPTEQPPTEQPPAEQPPAAEAEEAARREREAEEAARREREAEEAARRERERDEAMAARVRELEEAAAREAEARRVAELKAQREHEEAAAAQRRAEQERAAREAAEREAAEREAAAREAAAREAEARELAERERLAREAAEREGPGEAAETPPKPVEPEGPRLLRTRGLELPLDRLAARAVSIRGRSVPVGPLETVGPITVATYIAYVHSLPRSKRAVASAPLRSYASPRRKGGLLDRIPERMLTQPMRGVPLASAHDLATWLGMRVPTDAEAYALADVHTPKNLMWTASGAGVAWERDHAVSMSQAVEQARPIVFLVR